MTRVSSLPIAGLALLLASAALAQAPAPPGSPPSASAPGAEPAPAQPTLRDDRDAIEAGLKWLALVDGDKAGAAWDLASKQLQRAVPRAKFVAEMRKTRKPYGKLEARTAERFARAHEMPGAPSGDYVIIQYTARFATGKSLQENLVWAIEEGDVWRVSGYEFR